MKERTLIQARSSEVKQNNTASKTSKTEFSQSISSPIDHIMFLQRTIGNQAVQRLFKSGVIQTELKIGQPGDKYEQEADRVAEHVMPMSDPRMQRQTEEEKKKEELIQPKPLANQKTPLPQKQPEAGMEEDEEVIQTKAIASQLTQLVQRQTESEEIEEEKEEKIQAKETPDSASAVTRNVAAQINRLRGTGQPLPETTLRFFEPRFGVDLSKVRVHNNAQAKETAREMNARAYTIGQDIVFGTGQYAPKSIHGKNLLAHEITHTLQQKNSNAIQLQRQPKSGAGKKQITGMDPLSAQPVSKVEPGELNRDELMRRIDSRLDSCGDLFIYAAREILQRLYEAALAEAALEGLIFDIVFTFVAPSLSLRLKKLIDNLPKDSPRLVYQAALKLIDHTDVVVATAGTLAKNATVAPKPITDKKTFVKHLVSQYVRGKVAISDSLSDRNSVDLILLYNNYDAIINEGAEFYITQITKLLDYYDVFRSSGTSIHRGQYFFSKSSKAAYIGTKLVVIHYGGHGEIFSHSRGRGVSKEYQYKRVTITYIEDQFVGPVLQIHRNQWGTEPKVFENEEAARRYYTP